MSTTAFALALFALLLTPGPTNTLIALAGAERGWRGALKLTPLEVAAYGLVTLPLALLGSSLEAQHGPVRLALTLVAAAWVAVLAVRLWRLPQTDAGTAATSGGLALFITTLTNPKGLIIGLVLLPSQPHLGAAAGLFLLILIAVSAFWAGLGSLAGSNMGMTPVVRRVCAGWLGLLALWLAAAGLSA